MEKEVLPVAHLPWPATNIVIARQLKAVRVDTALKTPTHVMMIRIVMLDIPVSAVTVWWMMAFVKTIVIAEEDRNVETEVATKDASVISTAVRV